jgi:hypothetical protein
MLAMVVVLRGCGGRLCVQLWWWFVEGKSENETERGKKRRQKLGTLLCECTTSHFQGSP